MAERVEILVVATDAASQVMRGITSSFGQLGNIVQNLTGGRGLEMLASQAVQFGKDSVKAFTDGAMAAKELSRISGQSIENTSRFIQVLDDYKLTQQDALAATRALTKQGLEPSIETLARLSDQYIAIQDPQQRNEFILKNLGRAGLQWAQVLEQGSEALYRQADAINENLIFTEEMWQQAEMLRLAQDNLNDSWEGTKILVGSQLVPVLNDLLTAANNNAQADNQWANALYGIPIVGTIMAVADLKEAHTQNTKAIEEATKKHDEFGNEVKKTTEELKAEQEAVKALTKANEDYLSLVGTLAGNLTDYEEKHNQIQQELNEGKITIGEAELAWKRLADEQEQATNRMILNMLQQRLAVDGLDEAETAFLLQQGLEWGIYSQTAVDRANEINRNVEALVARYRTVPPVVQTDIITNYIENRIGTTVGFTPIPSPARAPRRRAGGGDVNAGMLYQVNETRQEFFQPSMSGTVIPLGNGNNGKGFTFVYSPQISLGTMSEVENIIAPAIESIIYRLQSDNQVGL